MVVVVIVAVKVMTPARSDMQPVLTGLESMRAGAIRGDMGSTIGVLLHCSQQVRLQLLGGQALLAVQTTCIGECYFWSPQRRRDWIHASVHGALGP